MLDIIVTHYKEPWEVGEKFFKMLDMQRHINFDDIRVIVVNDGPEYRLPCECFTDRPYQVLQYDIEHAGVSAARNEGLRRAEAEWVAFCDFDDMFASVYSLKAVLDVLPAPAFDLLWTDFISEDYLDGKLELHYRHQNCVFNHGKFYRRQALLENNLWFNEKLEFNEDSEFNSIANIVIDFKRTGRISTNMPVYAWCNNPDSVTHQKGSYIKSRIGMYWRNKSVLAAYEKYLPYERYCAMVARLCVDAYYTFNIKIIPEQYAEIYNDFSQFYITHKEHMWKVNKELMHEIKQVSYNDYVGNLDERGEMAVIDSISVTDWLKQIEREAMSDGGI